MRRKEKRFGVDLRKVFFIIIIFLVAFFFATKPSSIKEDILEKVKKFPEVQDYKKYPANVTFLTKDEVGKLAKDYPVIYSNITKDVYEVRFLSDDKGLLVIYDANENKIIRVFEIVGMKI